MRRLEVHTHTANYEIVIGSGLLTQIPHFLAQLGLPQDGGCLLVSDDNVAALGYPDTLQASLRKAGWPAELAVVPAGDASKSLSLTEALYTRLLQAKVRRSGIVIAVGGGVVGDLAGFAAATYLRGVHLIQVPTTLLAHDSSIGGKVGVNLPAGKNLVGAFYQPRLVVYDVDTLHTLPNREWRGGMAEVIKHAVIGEPELFAHLQDTPQPSCGDSAEMEAMIAQASGVKIAIVQADEREAGLRMHLNLGHTIGHAMEQASHYQLNHGEAVAIGMRMEAEIAVSWKWLDPTVRDQIITVLRQHHLPVVPPLMKWEQVLTYLDVDKKHSGSGWTFVLPREIGRVEVTREVTEEDVRAAWQASTS